MPTGETKHVNILLSPKIKLDPDPYIGDITNIYYKVVREVGC